MSGIIEKGLSVVFLLFILLGLSFTFYLYVPEHWQMENSWAEAVSHIMYYYLLAIFARTLFLLSLSFIENLFRLRMKPVQTFPLVTIIIPCFNEEVGLRSAVESVREINYPNLEILIVDDGSSDKTFEIAKELEEDFVVRLVHQDNAGKSMALNNGISQALGEYFVCMDADSVLSKNLLMDSIPFFEADEDLAAVAGAVVVGNSVNMITRFQKLEYIIGLNFHKMAQSCLNLVTIIPGPIGVFKKEAVIKIGGYHTDTYAEDCDLSMRLLMAGYNTKYTGKIKARTEAPSDFNSLITQRYRWSRGMIQSIIKSMKLLKSEFSMRGLFVVLYMFFETLIIPLINFTFVMVTLEFALNFETTELMGPFFVGLTVLDLTLCLYSIFSENELGSLFFLGIINRLTFGLAMEVIRFFSIIDELFKLPMKWGTLVRKGVDK